MRINRSFEKIAFVKTGWADYYSGDPIIGRHDYIGKFNDAHEKFNFLQAPDYLGDVSLSLLQRSMDDQESFYIYIASLKNKNVFILMNKTVSIFILYSMLDTETKLQAKELFMSALKIIQEDISGSLQDFYKLKPNIKETTTILDRVDRIIKNYSEIEFHIKTLCSSMN